MRLPSSFLAVALVLGASCVANAALTIVPTPMDPPQNIVPNVLTTDLIANFDGQILSQQMLLELTAGSIQQTAGGGNTPPSEVLIGAIPALAVDTFVAANGRTAETSSGVQVPGGAEYFGAPALKFDTAGLSVAWGTTDVFTDLSNFITARISLSNDAVGTLKYVGSTQATGQDVVRSEFTFDILDGVIGGDSGVDPVVDDLGIINPAVTGLNATVAGTVLGTDVETWESTLEFLDYTVNHGGNGETGVTQPALAATWDPENQSFSWDTSGSLRGDYRWRVLGSGNGTSDEGIITVQQMAVPEPASLALFGLALVGCIGASRRRS